MLEKLQTFPVQGTLLLITIFGLIAFVALNIVMYPYTAATAAAGAPSVVDFELTWGATRAQEINVWWWATDVHGDQFILNLIDFAYMPAYAFFIGGAVLVTARKLPEGRQRGFGYVATLMPFIAWLCDFIENVNLLQLLIGNVTDPIAITASVAATIKFTFLFIAIGAFGGHLIRLLIHRTRGRAPESVSVVPPSSA